MPCFQKKKNIVLDNTYKIITEGVKSCHRAGTAISLANQHSAGRKSDAVKNLILGASMRKIKHRQKRHEQ